MPEPHGILRRRVSENPEGLRHAVKDRDRVCRRGRKPNAEPEPRAASWKAKRHVYMKHRASGGREQTRRHHR
ncbi:hypothetical protein BCR44DRAFT_1454275, partial [Catenaria anguillulae PL171]